MLQICKIIFLFFYWIFTKKYRSQFEKKMTEKHNKTENNTLGNRSQLGLQRILS